MVIVTPPGAKSITALARRRQLPHHSPAGISEEPESPFHTDQMAPWVEGGMHPALLSRGGIEELAVSRTVLRTPGPLGPHRKTQEDLCGLSSHLTR